MKTSSLLRILTLVMCFSITPNIWASGGILESDGDTTNHYTITDNTDGTRTIAALTGKVTLTYDDGRPSITIDVKTGMILDANDNPVKDANGKTIRSLADLIKSDTSGDLKASILNLVMKVAGDVTKDSDQTTKLAALIKVVSEADPTMAEKLVTTAVDTLTKSGGSTDSITKAITATVAAAINTNTDSTVKDALVKAATDAASKNSVTFTQTTFESTSSNLENVLTTTSQTLDVTVISGSGR